MKHRMMRIHAPRVEYMDKIEHEKLVRAFNATHRLQRSTWILALCECGAMWQADHLMADATEHVTCPRCSAVVYCGPVVRDPYIPTLYANFRLN